MKIEKLNLYLDDVRTPTVGEWVVVRNYDEFTNIIRKNGLENFNMISLDHDLGDSAMIEYYTNVKNNSILNYNNIHEKTGYDAAKFLVAESMNTKKPLPQIYVHSANPIGSANIIGYINNYLKNCRLPQTCIHVVFEHKIDDDFVLSPEVRKSKWDKSKK